jgi:hypothetical protein
MSGVVSAKKSKESKSKDKESQDFVIVPESETPKLDTSK